MIQTVYPGPVSIGPKKQTHMVVAIPEDHTEKVYKLVVHTTTATLEIGGRRYQLKNGDSVLVADGRIVPPKHQLDERLRQLREALSTKLNLNRA